MAVFKNLTIISNVSMSDFIEDEPKTSSRCKYNHHSDYKPLHVNMYLQVMNYVIFSVAVFGVCANLLSFMTLSKEHPVNTSIFYMRSLAIADVGICLSYVVFDFQYKLYSHTLILDMTASLNHVTKRMYSYTKNFRLLFTSISDLITFLIAIDRYIVVCWPLRAVRIVSIKKSYVYVLLAVVISICDQITNFFKFRTRRSNNLCTGHERWIQRFTPFAKNIYLRYYSTFVRSPIFTLIPTAIVTAITVRLIITLRTAGAARKALSTNSQTSNDRSLTLTLVLILCFFLIKKSFSLRASVRNLILTVTGSLGKGNIHQYFNAIQHVLKSTVASANFCIYCASRRRFQRQLKDMFSRGR